MAHSPPQADNGAAGAGTDRRGNGTSALKAPMAARQNGPPLARRTVLKGAGLGAGLAAAPVAVASSGGSYRRGATITGHLREREGSAYVGPLADQRGDGGDGQQGGRISAHESAWPRYARLRPRRGAPRWPTWRSIGFAWPNSRTTKAPVSRGPRHRPQPRTLGRSRSSNSRSNRKKTRTTTRRLRRPLLVGSRRSLSSMTAPAIMPA